MREKQLELPLIAKKQINLLYAKGNTTGGKAGSIITIPIYGISKFSFI